MNNTLCRSNGSLECKSLSPSLCKNTSDYNNCLDLTIEKLNCLNSINGECKSLSVNECRDDTNALFKCTSLIDGWCINEDTNNCLKSIPNYNCMDPITN